MEARNSKYPLKLASTKQSLLLRLGIAMATIVMLAVVGTISSVFMADTSEGFAAPCVCSPTGYPVVWFNPAKPGHKKPLTSPRTWWMNLSTPRSLQGSFSPSPTNL